MGAKSGGGFWWLGTHDGLASKIYDDINLNWQTLNWQTLLID